MNSYSNNRKTDKRFEKFSELRLSGVPIKNIIDDLSLMPDEAWYFDWDFKEEFPIEYKNILRKESPNVIKFTIARQEAFEFLYLESRHSSDNLSQSGLTFKEVLEATEDPLENLTDGNNSVKNYHLNLLKYIKLRIEENWESEKAKKLINRSKLVSNLYEEEFRMDHEKYWQNPDQYSIEGGDEAYVSQRRKIYASNPDWNFNKARDYHVPEIKGEQMNSESLGNQVINLETENKNLKAENKNLIKESNNLDKEFRKEIEEKESQIENLKFESKKSREEITRLKRNNKNQVRIIENRDRSIEKLERKIEDLSRVNQDLYEENQNFSQKEKDLIESRDFYNQLYHEESIKNRKLEKELADPKSN